MNSVGDKCNDLKKEYDACFNSWFSNHFLKGNTNDEMCKELFKSYTDCVKAAIKEQKLDLHDIEKDQLHTEDEKPIPGKTS